MASPAAERKALLFSVGDVRLALRLSQLREILEDPRDGGEVTTRGETLPALPVAVALGLAGGIPRFALAIEGEPRAALRVDALHGIVELSRAEVFQLPVRTLLPQPPPFRAAVVLGGELALELDVSALGWAPIEPALDSAAPPPEVEAPSSGRELLFVRGRRTFGVPIALLVQIVQAPRIHPVPLAPPSHLGLAYHGRAIHPVLDPSSLFGDPPGPPHAASVLLVDAGGVEIGVAADRILAPGAAVPGPVARPSWDALFAP
jgi:chemotaxis signal transduction protein